MTPQAKTKIKDYTINHSDCLHHASGLTGYPGVDTALQAIIEKNPQEALCCHSRAATSCAAIADKL